MDFLIIIFFLFLIALGITVKRAVFKKKQSKTQNLLILADDECLKYGPFSGNAGFYNNDKESK